MTDITTQPAVFKFNNSDVRTITRNGEPWFVAVDVCKALGYLNTSKAIGDHLDDDEKGVTTGYTLGGTQKLTIISESGLYALVLRCRKPEARKFAKWVTSEVLPAIRKTGQYAKGVDTPMDAFMGMLKHGYFLMSHQNGSLVLNPVPLGAMLIDPESPRDLDNMIMNHVPLSQVAKVIDSANCRLAKYVNRSLEARCVA